MRKIRNERGFSLIEMMIVLLIISVLILLAIPNVTKHSKSIDDKGCSAYVKMVESQVEAYKLDTKKYPASLEVLVSEDYFPDTPVCPDGTALSLSNGKVKAVEK